jgi:hypothetical protein
MKPEDGLRRLGRITAPDLWPDIRRRSPRPEVVPGQPWSRFATIGLALAVAAGGIGLAAAAFLGGGETKPIAGPTASPTPTRPPPVVTTPWFGFGPEPPTHSDPWGAPTTLSLTCTKEGIELLSTEVPAQPDGVHVVVDNSGGATDLSSHMRGPRPVPGDRTLQFSLFYPDPDGFARVVTPWPPGPVEIACEFPGLDQRSETVHVTDPQRFWISAALACEETVPYERPADRTPSADLETAVRENVRGLLPADAILRAGYPQDPFPVPDMLVVRDGDPLAALSLPYYGEYEGWMPFVGEICVGSGIMGA